MIKSLLHWLVLPTVVPLLPTATARAQQDENGAFLVTVAGTVVNAYATLTTDAAAGYSLTLFGCSLSI